MITYILIMPSILEFNWQGIVRLGEGICQRLQTATAGEKEILEKLAHALDNGLQIRSALGPRGLEEWILPWL